MSALYVDISRFPGEPGIVLEPILCNTTLACAFGCSMVHDWLRVTLLQGYAPRRTVRLVASTQFLGIELWEHACVQECVA